MGLFGGDDTESDNPAQDQANYLLEQQIDQNKDELEQKRQSLVDQRTSIIKSQGGENWVPNRNQAYSGGTLPSSQDAQAQSGIGESWLKGYFR